jgi:hypothetical protein
LRQSHPTSLSLNYLLKKTKPIEIEIKRASEANRIAGCKDLCGDGICQEGIKAGKLLWLIPVSFQISTC